MIKAGGIEIAQPGIGAKFGPMKLKRGNAMSSENFAKY